MRLKIYNSLMGLCVATAAVSCSDALVDDVNKHPVGGEDSDMISFVVATDNTRGGSFGNRPGLSTRGSVTTSDNVINNSFAVYGDIKNLNSSADSDPLVLFYNEPVSYDLNIKKWTYSNLRYWISEREYSFVAIHPSKIINNEKGSNELTDFIYNNGAVSFNYTLPSDYTKTTDILIAGHRKQYSSSSSSKMVELNFAHILSRINFVANLEDSSVKIKNISIKGIASKADYNVGPADIKSGYKETSDLTGTPWTTAHTPIIILKNTNDNNIQSIVDNNTGKLSVKLFPDVDPLLIIPQTVTNDMVVAVTYSRGEGNEETIEGQLNSASVENWLSGKTYTYNFTIGSNNFILFDKPIVEDWNPAEGASYIIMD